MNCALVTTLEEGVSLESIKENITICHNSPEHIKKAVQSLKHLGKNIQVFTPKSSYKVITKPEYAEYTFTVNGELLPV